MGEEKRPTVTVTGVAPVTPDQDAFERLFDLSTVAPVHPRAYVLEALGGISERTLQRYMRELQPVGALTCTTEPGTGKTLFSEEDVTFLRRYQTAKGERARDGMAATQRERIAQLAAGVGRREGEAIRRELRNLASAGRLPSVMDKVRALAERMPHLATTRPHQKLVTFYATFYSTDLAQWEPMGAPPMSTVERAMRRVYR